MQQIAAGRVRGRARKEKEKECVRMWERAQSRQTASEIDKHTLMHALIALPKPLTIFTNQDRRQSAESAQWANVIPPCAA